MERVLEEFDKWFLHFALGVAIILIVQPIPKGGIDLSTTFKVISVVVIFLAIGGVLLYLSSKVRTKK